MKLKHRLSIFSILTFSIIITVFACVIYFAFYKVMQSTQLKSLESKTVLAAIFYLEKDEISTLEHENIKSQLARNISRNDIAVFDFQDKQVYGQMSNDKQVNSLFIDRVRKQEHLSMASSTYFYDAIYYHDNQGEFVVLARESKQAFNEQLNSLLNILIIVSLFSLVFIYFFSHFLGYVAYKPINNIISQIKIKNISNFHAPISLHKSYAEVNDLVKTYNQLIEQIAQSFSVQKNFIDYVSHELRTPITALLGTLDVTKNKPRSVQEYMDVLQKLEQYTLELQQTLDQMMLLSGAKTNFEMQNIRLDEVIWQVVENAIHYHQANISVDIQIQDSKHLNIKANEKLLELAFANIISNSIKYSDNGLVELVVRMQASKLQVLIKDQGIGISQADMLHIKDNFFRGANAQKYQGKGVGLSIAGIIFKIHHIDLQLMDNKPKGTLVILNF